MITQNEFFELKPGDQVEIVSSWAEDDSCQQNLEGAMDCWLGSVMTVASRYGTHNVHMEEDAGLWFWNCFCIERVVTDEPDEPDALSDADFQAALSMLF